MSLVFTAKQYTSGYAPIAHNICTYIIVQCARNELSRWTFMNCVQARYSFILFYFSIFYIMMKIESHTMNGKIIESDDFYQRYQ